MSDLSALLTTCTPGLLEMETSTMVAVFLPIFAGVFITIFLPLMLKKKREQESGDQTDE